MVILVCEVKGAHNKEKNIPCTHFDQYQKERWTPQQVKALITHESIHFESSEMEEINREI